MLSNRPYLLRAFHQWIVDSGFTPILVIDANHPRCKIPKDYAEDGEIVFNVSPVAVRDLKITNELVEFKASFSGVIHIISAPVKAVLSVYAEENGEGIFFDGEDDDGGSVAANHNISHISSADSHEAVKQQDSQQEVIEPPVTKAKPFLKLVE